MVKQEEKTIKVRCNNCMKIYEEAEDNQITECKKCGTDEYLMELDIEEGGEEL